MPQSITWLGNTYTEVGEVFLPKTSSGEAIFCDPSITTAVAADVASGKQFLLADGSIGTGTASGGGGGLTSVVTGTFQFSDTSATAHDISLNYTGAGYPIAALIAVNGGWYDTVYQGTVARYAQLQWSFYKADPTIPPKYKGTGGEADNYGVVTAYYKSSSSNATSLTTTGTRTANVFSGDAATAANSGCVTFKNNTTMSVCGGASSGSSRYGFMSGIKYRYWVMFSS